MTRLDRTFLGDSNVIAGFTSFGLDSSCGGTGGLDRLDRADDLGFINSFLKLTVAERLNR